MGPGAEALLTRDVGMAGPATPVDAAAQIIDEGPLRHLPAVDAEGAPLGLASLRDLVRQRLAQQQQHAAASLTADVTRSAMH